MMGRNYWSCSKFADWIRGTTKGGAKTGEDWDTWAKVAKEAYPIRYWIAEEGLDKLQTFIYAPIDGLYNVKYYINNRWVTRTHSLTAHPRDIKPGQWHDVGNRFLPCLFNELVDFVEIEQAWSHIVWGSKEDRAKYNAPFWASGWFRWRTWRSPQAGIDHLDWAMTLILGDDMGVEKGDENYGKPTGQAERAKEIKELYLWWTTIRPLRVDSMETSGWSAYCDRKRNDGTFFSILEKDDKVDTSVMLKTMDEIDQAYEKEDEEMMIRLIKARSSLWT
jgi:hypothetical protein